MRQSEPFHPGIPDIASMLAWPVGTTTPPYDDYNRIAGCVLRECGRLRYDLQFLEVAESISSRIPSNIFEKASIRVESIGLPLDLSCLHNGHSPIPPCWIVFPCETSHPDEPPEGLILTAGGVAGSVASIQILDRDGYLRLMESCHVDPHPAVRILFNTLEIALRITEYRELTAALVQRLERIDAQLSRIFASHGQTW